MVFFSNFGGGDAGCGGGRGLEAAGRSGADRGIRTGFFPPPQAARAASRKKTALFRDSSAATVAVFFALELVDQDLQVVRGIKSDADPAFFRPGLDLHPAAQ